MENAARYIILAGVVLIVLGSLLYGLGRLNIPLGRLPGDIHIERQNGIFYFPVTTSIILSILLTLIVNILGWFIKK